MRLLVSPRLLEGFIGSDGAFSYETAINVSAKHTINKCSLSKVEFDKAALAATETKMKHLRRELCQHLPSCATGSEKRIALHSHEQTGSRQAMGDKDSQDAVNRTDDLTPLPRLPPASCHCFPLRVMRTFFLIEA